MTNQDVTKQRKRPRHAKQDLSRTGNAKFMRIIGKQPILGKWTPVEHYVFLGILRHLGIHKRHTNLEINTEQISKLYDGIIKLVKIKWTPLPPAYKSPT